MGLQRTTQPVTEPVPLKLVAKHCRNVGKRDLPLLQIMAIAAREWCEEYLSEQLCTAQFLWTIDRFINLYLYQTSLWTQQIWPWYFQSQSLLANRLPNTWYALWPPVSPVVSIDQIQYIDLDGNLQTLDPSQYLLSQDEIQARITPAFGDYWPPTQMRVDAVKITLTAGRPPGMIKASWRLAICQLAAYWFDQRETVSFDEPRECPLNTLSLLGPPANGRYLGQ